MSISLIGFDKKGFGYVQTDARLGGYASFIVKRLSFKVFPTKGRFVYGGKTKDETALRNRYVAETQTDKRQTNLNNTHRMCNRVVA